MKITYKSDYALKTILDLALNYHNGVVTLHDLAKRLDIPVNFLEQILIALKNGGFVKSRRGKTGGYLLARHPSQIKIGEVIRLIEGSIDPIACVHRGYKRCRDLYKCVFREFWQGVESATSNIIDNVTFEDLVNKTRLAKESLMYSI